MKIQKAVLKLNELGQMPNADSDDERLEELSEKYDKLLEQVKLPLNYQEAELLVQLFPEESLFEVEWSLLHLFETIYDEITQTEYLQLIEKCSSKEWKKTLKIRFKNAEKSK